MGLGLFRSSTSSTRRRSGRSMRRAIQAPATSWQRHARTLPRRSLPSTRGGDVLTCGYTMQSARPTRPRLTSQSPRALACVGSAHARAVHAGMAWHCSVIDRTGVRQHEWPKHGSCIANGLSSPADFFNMSLALRSLRLPPPAACCNRTATRCNIQPMPSSVSLPLRPLCHRCRARPACTSWLRQSDGTSGRVFTPFGRSEQVSQSAGGRTISASINATVNADALRAVRACPPRTHGPVEQDAHTPARQGAHARTAQLHGLDSCASCGVGPPGASGAPVCAREHPK